MIPALAKIIPPIDIPMTLNTETREYHSITSNSILSSLQDEGKTLPRKQFCCSLAEEERMEEQHSDVEHDEGHQEAEHEKQKPGEKKLPHKATLDYFFRPKDQVC